MKALVFEGQDSPLQYRNWEDPVPGAGEALVRLEAAALNHRDVFITQGKYPRIKTPAILGSDGAGWHEGRQVLINPGKGWGSDPRVQSAAYEIIGMPSDGTFAEYIAVPQSSLVDKPAHLSWEEAAALPLAGLTAYRALFTQGRLTAGEKVLITGAGGGVALLAMQFALAAGAEVWTTSGSGEKLERCRDLGVRGGVNYREKDWHKTLLQQAGEFDLIIDSAGGEGFGLLMRLARPGGRMVAYGGSLGTIPNFSPQILFWKQLHIIGSTMGTDAEFAAMTDFVHQHQIRPVVDSVFALWEGNAAFARMEQGLQFGKIILTI